MTWLLLAGALLAATWTSPFARRSLYRHLARGLCVVLLAIGLSGVRGAEGAATEPQPAPPPPPPQVRALQVAPATHDAAPQLDVNAFSLAPGDAVGALGQLGALDTADAGAPQLSKLPVAEDGILDAQPRLKVTTPLFDVPDRGRYVFLIDCSGSMRERDGTQTRLEVVVEWLLGRFQTIPAGQEIALVFFSKGEPKVFPAFAPQGAPHFLTAIDDGVRTSLRALTPGGSTEVIPALQLALRWNPDGVFVLSDGDFTDTQLEAADGLAGWMTANWRTGKGESRLLASNSSRELPIDGTFVGNGEAPRLRQLTQLTGGSFLKLSRKGP